MPENPSSEEDLGTYVYLGDSGARRKTPTEGFHFPTAFGSSEESLKWLGYE